MKPINVIKNHLNSKYPSWYIALLLCAILWCTDPQNWSHCKQNIQTSYISPIAPWTWHTIYCSKENQAEWEQNVEIAKQEMKKYDIPSFQRKWYVKGKSEQAFANITPQWYWDFAWNFQRWKRYKNKLWRDPYECLWYAKWEKLSDGTIAKKDVFYTIPKRDDAWRLYLGMPQLHHTFGISDYRPTIAQDSSTIYFKPNYRSNDIKQNLVNEYFSKQKRNDLLWKSDENKIISNERALFRAKTDSLEQQNILKSNPITAQRMLDNPLWDFTVMGGVDKKWTYLAIYDKRDLQPFRSWEWASTSQANENDIAKQMNSLQQEWYKVTPDTEISTIFWAWLPFEIYDRIYYDSQTLKIIP